MTFSLFLVSLIDASAQTVPASDLSITSLGFQGFTTSSVGRANGAPGADVDFLLGQRLRWTLGDSNGVSTRALADARFTYDPQPGLQGEAQPIEVHNVRQLGLEIHGRTVTVDVGRHPVYRGGPRLVDGIQALIRTSPTVDIGFWGGLAPSVFDTDFRLRPGAGPIVAWTGSRAQASVVGEVSSFDGTLDRAGVLGMGRWSMNRVVEVSGRIDVNLATADEDNGGPALADAQFFTVISPTRATRFELLYNAFSSYRYVSSADADPEQRRFAQRLQQLGQVLGVNNEQVDPTINQLFGATFRAVKPGVETSPYFEVRGRYRQNPDVANRFARLQPTVGAVRIGGRADILLTGNWLQVDERTQFDVGVLGAWALSDLMSVDLSFRGLTVPGDYGFGVYTDLFIDFVAPGPDLLLLGGVSYLSEPDVDVSDGELGVFFRMSKYLRPNRSRRPKAPSVTKKRTKDEPTVAANP
ncbi:MAG: hypothetical protein AAGA48_16335 [Myxococcota bacterium]